MKEKKQVSFKALPPDIKRLGIPLLSLIGITLCFFLASKVGFNKITDQTKEIQNLEKNNIILKKKEEALSVVQKTLGNDIQFFYLALPDSNPVFSIIYQIKEYSSQQGLLLANIKGGSESKGKTYLRTDVNFNLDGSLPAIISFLKLTQNFSPIVTVEKFELSQIVGVFRASVTLRGYWAAYPVKIPAVTQSLSNFSDEEIEMILKISKLLVPRMLNFLPTQDTTRTNPFE